MTDNSAYARLLARMADIHNVDMANAVLNWDQRTYMPAQGCAARAKQLATLSKMSHELFVAKETGDVLAAAEAEHAGAGADSDERAILRVTRRGFDKATKVPTSLVVEMAETTSLAEDVWQ